MDKKENKKADLEGENAPGAYPIHDRRPIAYRGIGRRNNRQNNNAVSSSQIPPELRNVNLQAATRQDSTATPVARSVCSEPSVAQRQVSFSARVLEHLQAESTIQSDSPDTEQALVLPERISSENVDVLSTKGSSIQSTTSSRRYVIIAVVILAGLVVGVVIGVSILVLLGEEENGNSALELQNATNVRAGSDGGPFVDTTLEPEPATHPTPTPSLIPSKSLAPSESPPRDEAIWNLLFPISGHLLDDNRSAQNQALNWLTFRDTYFRSVWEEGPMPDNIKSELVERYIMAVLYYATGGGTSWEGDLAFLDRIRSVCSWADESEYDDVTGRFEIYCDEDSVYIEWIVIDEFGISGTLPAEIGYLTNLNVLNIANNYKLEGGIPDLGRLTALEDLRLFGNSLEGSIPSAIGQLTLLTHLGLNMNDLTGSIPDEIGNLSALRNIFFHGNYLTGTMPLAVQALEDLSYAWFHHNNMNGNFTGFCDSPNRPESLRTDCLRVECDCCVMCCYSTLLCS